MGRFSIVRPHYFVYCGICFGISVGCLVAIVAGETLSSAMRMAWMCHVSIIGLSSTLFLPVLLSAIAVYLRRIAFWVCIIVSKTFSFSCALTAVASLAVLEGEPRLLLLMFSDCLMFPVLCWFWLHLLDHGRSCLFRCMLPCLVILAAIGFTDYWFISPLLALY